MNNRTHLHWDSAFFNLAVDKITLDENFTAAELTALMTESPPDLCYIFAPAELSSLQRNSLSACGAVEYDRKLTYRKDFFTASSSTEVFKAEELTPEMYALAVAAGWRSRFNLDPSLQPFFRSLYHLWLEKAFNDPDALVLVYKEQQSVVGLVSVEQKNEQGVIGLLAVNEQFRGRGIGSRLLNECDNYYIRHQINHATVVTQGGNETACRLYEKNGYKIVAAESIWHWWKRSVI